MNLLRKTARPGFKFLLVHVFFFGQAYIKKLGVFNFLWSIVCERSLLASLRVLLAPYKSCTNLFAYLPSQTWRLHDWYIGIIFQKTRSSWALPFEPHFSKIVDFISRTE